MKTNSLNEILTSSITSHKYNYYPIALTQPHIFGIVQTIN